ncbi:uncharacterized protein EDB93DRAFT_1338616 [Suillus bovinus]|uniref:uncharacterized protein n=1 Tax=Suillus bovinus TaxID=48563 RepID=UPI001B881E8E|nr:uncharacterized protein EDB93DRAFT_1338616 [Suillus bovinus]KAG2141426.1 hypothetical protein EDB93DRAFT_1338616 [Suillus bovinus]
MRLWNFRSTGTLLSYQRLRKRAAGDVVCGFVQKFFLAQVYSAVTGQYNGMFSALFAVQCFASAPITLTEEVRKFTINIPTASQLGYQAAVEGIVLLKNDGSLPLSSSINDISLISPWTNATTQLRGTNHFGVVHYLHQPCRGLLGTNIPFNDTSEFAAAAKEVDIYVGDIDLTIEAEVTDRYTITWPGDQLDLIAQLQMIGKSLFMYTESYVNEITVTMTGMNLRPNKRTCLWIWRAQSAFYYKWVPSPAPPYSIQALVDGGEGKYAAYSDDPPLAVSVTDSGKSADYTPRADINGDFCPGPGLEDHHETMGFRGKQGTDDMKLMSRETLAYIKSLFFSRNTRCMNSSLDQFALLRVGSEVSLKDRRWDQLFHEPDPKATKLEYEKLDLWHIAK